MRRLAILCLLLSGIPTSGQVDAPWREARRYVALFAPADGRAAAYRVYVSALDLDMALRRPYGAQQPRVARGARSEGGQVVESWTLISPYPDTALPRLETGTLLVVLRLL